MHALCRFLPLLLAAILAVPAPARGSEIRIKDITDVDGVRVNQLTGMGLVVGLNNTGSNSPTTRRFAVNMLQRFGQRFDPSLRAQLETLTTQKTNNLSVVVVTADLPAFARRGTRIDVVVSAFDDSKSLQGGTLVMTPLFGADGQVYAVGSGQISIGGFSFSGEAGTVTKNHPTTGRIPNGATVEEETVTPLADCGVVRLQLKSPDFETVRRIAEKIRTAVQTPTRPIDSRLVEIVVPPAHQQDIPGFLGQLGLLTIIPDVPARVVINERTGTIIIGNHVRLSSVLITHANLAVITKETPTVSQPAPFSQGETTVTPRTDIEVIEEEARVNTIPETVTVGDLAQALNALGVSPRDLSSIFQQLKESGSMHAELEFK